MGERPEDQHRLATLVAEKVVAAIAAQPDDRPLLTVDQVAERLAIGKRTAYDLIYPLDKAALRSFPVGPKAARRVDPRDLDQYVADRRNGD